MADGLIWSGIGQGIANAGSSFGNMMMRDYERQSDRDWREKQAQEQRDFREEQNALYRRTADQQMAGRGGAGAGGLNPDDLAPGGKLAGMVAGQLGMTEPEYKQLYEARKTGDMSSYAQDVTRNVRQTAPGEEQLGAVEAPTSDQVLRKTSQLTTETTKEVPPALKAEFQAKAKTLAQLEESYALTGKYDDVMKGRKTGFETGVGQGVLAGAIPAGQGSAAVAAASGKQMLNTEGGETYNMYTGESKTTPLGKAQISEAAARAGELGALGKKYGKEIEKIDAEISGGMFNKNSSERLSSVVNSANATIKSLMDAGKGSTPESKAAWDKSMSDATAVRDKAQALQNNALDIRDNPKPTPAPGEMPRPKSAEEVAKLKPNTRFIAPDGSIRIR
jgi:hypothetical protein